MSEFIPASAHELVLTPWQWRLVGSCGAPELAPSSNRAYAKWLHDHSERHQHREILMPLQGGGFTGLHGIAYACEPGSVFLFDHLAPHASGYPPFQEDALHLWLCFIGSDQAIARLLQIRGGRIAEPRAKPLSILNHPLPRVLMRAWDEAAAATALPRLQRLKVVSALAGLLAHLAEHGEALLAGHDAKTHRRDMVGAVMRQIVKTSGNGFAIADVAAITGYSKFHFLRVFKQETGKTIHEFIDEVRLEKTRQLLSGGRLKKEVADLLGFSCQAAFSHWYAAASTRYRRS